MICAKEHWTLKYKSNKETQKLNFFEYLFQLIIVGKRFNTVSYWLKRDQQKTDKRADWKTHCFKNTTETATGTNGNTSVTCSSNRSESN